MSSSSSIFNEAGFYYTFGGKPGRYFYFKTKVFYESSHLEDIWQTRGEIDPKHQLTQALGLTEMPKTSHKDLGLGQDFIIQTMDKF